MQSAGARALREDDSEMSREAVLLQWERKIEAAERLDDQRHDGERLDGERVDGGHLEGGGHLDGGGHRDGGSADGARVRRGRFVRSAERGEDEAPDPLAQPVPLPPADGIRRSRRFERSTPPPAGAAQPSAERRTITITGQPTPARRRRAVVDSQLAQPDRIALWAFLLGLLLVAVAAGTAHA
jgi:hypothetical protein